VKIAVNMFGRETPVELDTLQVKKFSNFKESKNMKQIKAKAKLQIQAGKATPAPPVGPSLGQHGINLGAFCTQFNNATKSMGRRSYPC